MPSLSSRAVARLLRVLNAKRVWEDPTSAEHRIQALAMRPMRYSPPRRLRSDITIEAARFAGWPVYLVRPRGQEPTGALVYAHGGGWVHEIHSLHWRFVAKIVAEAAVTAVVPIYPLAPFGTAGEVVPVVADLADQAAERYGPLVLAGDSAGGQIALSTALTRRDEGRPPADLTLLIAPALDASLTNPEIADVELQDPWLSVPGTRVFVEAWRGDLPVEDPHVSPLNGEMTGLGPVSLYCGTHDIVYPDVLLLVRKLQAAGVPVRLRTGTGLIHVYPLLPTREGAQARADIVAEVRAAVRRTA